jgi:propanol-preferring alcohol dehydrogenase
MRALQLRSIHQPLVAVDLPDPTPAPGEVTVAIEACGICHSDAHYRAGFGGTPLPRTLGHEVAGVVAGVGAGVTRLRAGQRVAIHYLRACHECRSCVEDGEQFCESGGMIGKHFDGGYADFIAVPEWNAVPVPDEVPLDVAAVMMCSTATAFHALRLAGLAAGKSVAVLGYGGLGVSAVQLSRALGAARVAAVDVVAEKLASAAAAGAVAIDGTSSDLTGELLAAVDGRGFDIAVDFTGRPSVALPALRALKPGGALVFVALSEEPFTFNPYRDVLGKERRILGCSDHTRNELTELLALAARGAIDVGGAISARVPLEAAPVNAALDALEHGTAALRTVISHV